MIKDLPDGSLWSVGGVGRTQLPMNIISIIAGGGVRVGLEDNIWFDADRTRLASNYELVERVVNIAAVMGVRPYTPVECREILSL